MMTTLKLLPLLGAGVMLAALTTPAAPAPQTPADQGDKAVAYAQCVRDHGYTEFPDPQPDGGFKFLINPENVSRFKAAADACHDLAPEGMRDDAISPQQLDALIKLSQCVRDNGIAYFPDPSSKGAFDLSGTSIKPGDKRFEAAMAACRDLAKDAPIMIGG